MIAPLNLLHKMQYIKLRRYKFNKKITKGKRIKELEMDKNKIYDLNFVWSFGGNISTQCIKYGSFLKEKQKPMIESPFSSSPYQTYPKDLYVRNCDITNINQVRKIMR